MAIHANGLAPRLGTPGAPEASRQPRILWAEDNPQDRLFIQEALAGVASVRLTLVTDGAALLETLGQWSPDLVVLDLKMPRLGGIDALRAMSAHAQWKSLRVVVFSSGERPDEMALCRSLGAMQVLVKPLDFDLFSSDVQRIAGLAAAP